MFHWIHHLFNPHCLECKVCEVCEVLKMELASVKQERDRLLNKLLSGSNIEPTQEERTDPENFKPLFQPKHIPFAIRRQTLEAEDRNKAKILRDRQKELEINKPIRPAATDKPLTVTEMEEIIVGEEDAVSGSDEEVQAR